MALLAAAILFVLLFMGALASRLEAHAASAWRGGLGLDDPALAWVSRRSESLLSVSSDSAVAIWAPASLSADDEALLAKAGHEAASATAGKQPALNMWVVRAIPADPFSPGAPERAEWWTLPNGQVVVSTAWIAAARSVAESAGLAPELLLAATLRRERALFIQGAGMRLWARWQSLGFAGALLLGDAGSALAAALPESIAQRYGAAQVAQADAAVAQWVHLQAKAVNQPPERMGQQLIAAWRTLLAQQLSSGAHSVSQALQPFGTVAYPYTDARTQAFLQAAGNPR